jgi:hypothetical protein
MLFLNDCYIERYDNGFGMIHAYPFGMSCVKISKAMIVVAVILVSGLFTAIKANAGGGQLVDGHSIRLEIQECASVATSGPDNLVLSTAGDRNGTLLLQYTAVNTAGHYRKILVNWKPGDSAPHGTSLRMLCTSVPAGCGVAGPEVVVSGQPVVIIHDIPSCYTGRGTSGSLVRYQFCIDDASRLLHGETTTVTLVFTISDDS